MKTLTIAVVMGMATTAHAGSKAFDGHAEGTVRVVGSVVEIVGEDFVVAVEGAAKDALAKQPGKTVTAHGKVRMTDRSKLPIRGVIDAKFYEETIPLSQVADMLGILDGGPGWIGGSEVPRREATHPSVRGPHTTMSGHATTSAGTKR